MTDIDVKIKETRNNLNKLIVEKFIKELTFEQLKIVSNKHNKSKWEYTAIYVNVPQIHMRGERTYSNMVRQHICKSEEFNQSIQHVAYKNSLVDKMRESVSNLYLK
jgi:hypothetical protein